MLLVWVSGPDMSTSAGVFDQMPKLARWTWTGLAVVLLGAACTNDYEQFDFGAGPPKADAGGQAGTAGTTQGSGGQLGSAPDASDSGGAARDAQGGTSGGGATDAQGGTSAGGTTGDAQGGTSGGGTGGQVGADGGGTAGTGGTAGSAGGCGQFEVRCSGTCTDARGRANCGACDNDCEQQGLCGGFQCIDMRCGCTMSSQCGQGPRARCSMLAARCVCNDNQCEAGERCGSTSGNCTCNGGPACSQGQICCQSGGCRTGSCE